MGACQVNRSGNRTGTESGGGRTGRNFLLVTALAWSGGCALMANSTTQSIEVASTPPGARVLIDGRAVGETPLRVELPRRRRSPSFDSRRRATGRRRCRSGGRSVASSWQCLLAGAPSGQRLHVGHVGREQCDRLGARLRNRGRVRVPEPRRGRDDSGRERADELAARRTASGRQLPSGLVAAEARSAAARFRDHGGAAAGEGPATSGGAQ